MNRDRFHYPLMTIGIIGGGQLGKMMAQKAKKMGLNVVVLDPTPNCPATQVANKQIAIRTTEALDAVGVLAVEMFLTKEGEVLVNETAPRPHNSGHYTLQACATCQFEQHIRAVSGLLLGSAELLSPAVMINPLGSEGHKGNPIVEGVNKALSIPGLSFHFYGKETTRPFRKMGHVTILDRNLERAIEKAKEAKGALKVKTEVST